MKSITVVSLGPGSPSLLTVGALQALREARRVILRTGQCQAAQYLREQGIVFETLDHLHDTSEDFEELIERTVDTIKQAARDGGVCYAVLDAAWDETVAALRRECPVKVLPGVPLSAPFLAAAPPQRDIEIQPASGLNVTSTQHPLLIVEVNSRILAGECKLQLLRWLDGGQEILFFPPGQEERPFISLPLEDMDRQPRYDHTCAVLIPALPLMQRTRFDFYDLVRIMALLRGEGGCPWDREQTHQSLRRYLIEEAYEAAAAIDEEDWDHLADELGDVLLQIVFHARVGEDTGTLELNDITTHICQKMIDRHRHIFGKDRCDTPEAVKDNWEKIKKQERGFTTHGQVLSGVPRNLPSLVRADKVQQKAANVGFDWPDARQALDKAQEELGEVREALPGERKHLEEEVGDLLFACVHAARMMGIDSDTALAKATEKFISRFCAMENAILQAGKRFEDLTISEMDVYWKGSKQRREQ